MSNATKNILFILTDDQGYWTLGCSGNSDAHTPNIDMLAENGTMFNNFFCVSPVCSPARASILTGDIPSSHGITDWLDGGNLDARKYDATSSPMYSTEIEAIDYLRNQLTYTDVL
jgi:arylsulfatase A-like enzyme